MKAPTTNILIEIATGDKTSISGHVEIDDSYSSFTAEILLKRYLSDVIAGAIYSTTTFTGEISPQNSQINLDKNTPIKNLGTHEEGLKYLRVSLPERSQFHISQRTYKQQLQEYITYRVPIYVPFIIALIWIATLKPAPDEVCFAHVGCFSLEAPWTERPIIFNFVPQSPAAINTTFRIYSRDNLDGKVISGRNKTPDVSGFQWDNKGVVAIVHGFTDNADTWIKNLSLAFLKTDDVNVIGVDWHLGADMYYPQVVANTRVVAAEIAMFLEYLKTTRGEKLRYIHLVGHSLGSHIAGYVGKNFPGVSKITALDPASPLFDTAPPEIRLHKTDASEVEVIHSNIGPIGFGLKEPVGTIDIYLNDGQDQKGCNPMMNTLLKPPTIQTIMEMKDIIACSHRRAYEVYEEAILSQYPLKAHLCSSWEEVQSGSCLSHCQSGSNNCISLSQNSEQLSQQGIYYMVTTDKYPFCSQFVKVSGNVCEHQIELQNVQLYIGFSELNDPIFEGTVTKLQPIDEWIGINCHLTQGDMKLKLNVQFETVDIIQAPICFSDLSLEIFNTTSGDLRRSSVNYTEVYRGQCSVVVFP